MRKLIIFFRNLNRLWLLMALALVLGLAAAMLFSSYLKGREEILIAEAKKRASGGDTVEIITPSLNVPKGTVLGTQNLSKREILADLVTEEMVLVSDFGRVDGIRATRSLQAGLPLRFSDVMEKIKTFSESLEVGRRAITIEVDEINSMAQMVKPGNIVDLMLIVPDPGDTQGGQRVVLVLEKVKVLATGQNLESNAAGKSGASRNNNPSGQAGSAAQRYSNFTFEVSPQEAARIALAQSMGKIRAMLRGNDDDSKISLANISTQAMLNQAMSNPSEKPAKPLNAATLGQDPVQYIIGGKGNPGAVNINIPSLFPPSVGDRRSPASAEAAQAALAGALAVPGMPAMTGNTSVNPMQRQP
jgi:pilus assembly protein CpaB